MHYILKFYFNDKHQVWGDAVSVNRALAAHNCRGVSTAVPPNTAGNGHPKYAYSSRYYTLGCLISQPPTVHYNCRQCKKQPSVIYRRSMQAHCRLALLKGRRQGLDVEGSLSFNMMNVNDPYAGSPTKTLLRLLLPLNDQVWFTSRWQRPCGNC